MPPNASIPGQEDRPTRRVRTALFNLLTLLSLILLAALPAGYLGTFGPVVTYSRPSATSALVHVRLSLERGRVALWYEAAPPPPKTAAPPAGMRWQWESTFWHAPDLRRSLWEFDAHSLPFATARLYLVACPIWCVAAVCLILPAIWLKRRRWDRNQAEVQGFAVFGHPPPEQPIALASTDSAR